MKIRDSHARLNGDKTTTDVPSDGLEILSDDGRCIFQVRQESDHEISVWAGEYFKSKGVIYEDRFVIVPHSSNVVNLRRVPDELLTKMAASKTDTNPATMVKK